MRLFNRTNKSLLTPEEREERRGLLYAFALHLGLVLLLLIGLFSTPKAPNPVQIELWAEGEMAIAENMDEPTIEPETEELEPELTLEPEPEVEPEPEPEPPPLPEPEPEPQPEAPKVTPPPAEDPDIALEKARKEKEEAGRKAKAEAEQKAKAEAERKAKAEAEQKAKAEAERKAKAEAERKAKADADRKAKAAAEQKAKEDAFRAALLGDGKQIAGASGGTANRNQVAGGGGDDGYGAKVRACVRPRVVYNTPPRSGSQNPALQYRVDLNPDGTVRNVRITRSSGIALFDDAVQKGIAKCSPFPKPSNGRYPSFIDGEYRMYD